MSAKWLFSNHMDIEVATTLLLQSVVIVLSAVCAVKSVLPCCEKLSNNQIMSQADRMEKLKRRILLHARNICHTASHPGLSLLGA